MAAPEQLDAERPTFDPLTDGFFDDPYPHYAELRTRNPIHVDARGVTFCFAYDDVRTLLIDSRRTSMDRERSAPDGETRSAPPTFPLALLNRDPPDHTRIRKLMSSTFTPRRLALLMASMSALVDQLLDDVEGRYEETGEPVDLVRAVTFPFPFQVISAMLGMPDGDDTQLKRWAHDISVASDPMVPKERVTRAVAAYHAITDYIAAEVLPWKRHHRRDDLLSVLLAAEDDGELSTGELLDNVGLLYVAGHETTTGLIGNAILNLLRHRDQLELLGAEPALLGNAIEELNRYDSSIQLAWRYVIEDFDLRGGEVVLPRGTMAFVCCGSANHDPEHFGVTADRLDITRADAKDSLSFGNGLHFCLGAHLARREAALVVSRVFDRFPGLELAGETRFVPRATFRALEALPVVLS
jgi:cytochrome P450